MHWVTGNRFMAVCRDDHSKRLVDLKSRAKIDIDSDTFELLYETFMDCGADKDLARRSVDDIALGLMLDHGALVYCEATGDIDEPHVIQMRIDRAAYEAADDAAMMRHHMRAVL